MISLFTSFKIGMMICLTCILILAYLQIKQIKIMIEQADIQRELIQVAQTQNDQISQILHSYTFRQNRTEEQWIPPEAANEKYPPSTLSDEPERK